MEIDGIIVSEQIIELFDRSITKDGLLFDPKNKANQKEAKEILETGNYPAYATIDGHAIHDTLLVIAFPNSDI